MLKQNKVSPCHDDDEIEKIPTTSKVGAGMKHKPHRYNLHDCFKTEYSKQIVFYFLLKKAESTIQNMKKDMEILDYKVCVSEPV